MLSFLRKLSHKREGLRKYSTTLDELIKDGILSDEEKNKLKEVISEYQLKDSDLKSMHAYAVRHLLEIASSDRRLSKEELERVESLAKYFGIGSNDISINQSEMTKFQQLDLIEKGELPDISSVAPQGNIKLAAGEILHYVEAGRLTKIRKITERFNYSGLTGSVRIMKGLRYRTGSVKVSTVQKDVLALEDVGAFWVSNYGIGFKGSRKHFNIDYKKIASFEFGQLGLLIFKQGKETPYMPPAR